MTKAGRGARAALMAALLIMVAERASANDEPIAATDPREATIVLHVANHAALPRHVLDGARARVASVYKLVGVRTAWVDGEDTVRQPQDGRLHLTVILLSRDMAQKKISAEGITDDVLAQALPAGGRAYVFYDRVATMSGNFSIRLGDVIAHEVGHLVLPTRGHSRSGIMRPDMDLQHATLLQSFDKTQARTIRTVLAKLTAGASGP